jgi:hypothetical protein
MNLLASIVLTIAGVQAALLTINEALMRVLQAHIERKMQDSTIKRTEKEELAEFERLVYASRFARFCRVWYTATFWWRLFTPKKRGSDD